MDRFSSTVCLFVAVVVVVVVFVVAVVAVVVVVVSSMPSYDILQPSYQDVYMATLYGTPFLSLTTTSIYLKQH